MYKLILHIYNSLYKYIQVIKSTKYNIILIIYNANKLWIKFFDYLS